MRLVKIGFNGYRRLADATCNVDGKLIAFLAANELGKTALIQGLNWLWGSSAHNGPLPLSTRTRGVDVSDDQYVVWAEYRLDDADRTALQSLDVDGSTETFRVLRKADGDLYLGSDSALSWSAEKFGWISDAVLELESELQEQGVSFVDHTAGVDTAIDTVIDVLTNGLSRAWTEEERAAVAVLAEALDDPDPGVGAQLAEKCGDLAVHLRDVLGIVGNSSPDWAVRRVLRDRCPRFALFSAEDRALKASYDLAESDIAVTPPAALDNLLRFANTDVSRLRTVVLSRDVTFIHNTLRKINDALHSHLRPAWRQSELTVELAVDGSQVRILIKELREGGATTSIEERSDGLRAFIALVCFLQTRGDNVPPVLLIEHPENDLHPNAQADLINILHTQQVARQVLYTTHGVSCLPPDIGTGLRFLVASPTSPDVSVFKNGFWHSGEAGYDDLQVLAGAERSAFTRCSRVVIAEGPSEMILLPTLIRLATGEPELPYRVTGGLANTAVNSPKLRDVATSAAYLVDGDAAGRRKQKELVKHVPESTVFSLPAGRGLEDLITVQCYLEAVNGHLAETGVRDIVTSADLPPGKTRGHSVGVWCKERGVEPPGKPVIASRLIREPDNIGLEEDAAIALKELHGRLVEIFNV
jgi:hypothetical protein